MQRLIAGINDLPIEDGELIVRALDYAVVYTTERKQFGQSISSFQMIQGMLADMATKVEAARQLVHAAARAIDAGSSEVTRIAQEQVLAGKNIMQGPKNPGLHQISVGAKIAHGRFRCSFKRFVRKSFRRRATWRRNRSWVGVATQAIPRFYWIGTQ